MPVFLASEFLVYACAPYPIDSPGALRRSQKLMASADSAAIARGELRVWRAIVRCLLATFSATI